MSHLVQWVVKVSKLCNLRCQYCYEWNELANPERMSLDFWQQLLEAVSAYHTILENQLDAPIRSSIIWHGGEPLLLPAAYFEEVCDLQRSIFPAEWLAERRVYNTVQTNLYAVSDVVLDTLAANHIGIGVSFDTVSGVRVSVGGAQTEARVLQNMDRLRARQVPFGIVTVLAQHTLPKLREIYDFLCEQEVAQLKILPLFNGPDERPVDRVTVSSQDIVDGLCDLFVYWFESGGTYPVAPLQEYLWTTVMKMTGLQRSPFDRRHNGEHVLIVNLNGCLYESSHRYGAPSYLGNLKFQSLPEILASPVYAASLDQNDLDRQNICGRCEYLGACSTYPIFANPDGGLEQGQCLIAQQVCRFIEDYLRRQEMTEDVLATLFKEIATEPLALEMLYA